MTPGTLCSIRSRHVRHVLSGAEVKRGRLMKKRELMTTAFFACAPAGWVEVRRISAGETVIALGKCKHTHGKAHHFLTSVGIICVYTPAVNEYFEEL